MATNKKTKPAALLGALENVAHNKVEHETTGIERREEHIRENQNKHSHQPVANGLKIKLDHLKTFEALTENQQKFFDAYKCGDYFMGLFGSPGTGKTFCAMYKALEEVLDKSNPFKQVVVVRSAVQTRDQGFVSGDLNEKSAIYELPYTEICTTLFDRPDAWERLKEQGFARFITTTAIRGISIDDAIVIVDECQSMSWHELSTIMGRIGYRSKIIFSGDRNQNDLIKSKYDVSGFDDFVKVARSMNAFSEIFFTPEDIVRSSLVKEWIMACTEKGMM